MTALFSNQAETAGVMVRVAVAYLADQSSPEGGRWFWSCHIRIDNHCDDAVQLLARHLVIKDQNDIVHEVRGEDVVGDKPRIEPGASYDYVSGCSLETPSGALVGEFDMFDEQGSKCDIVVPPFVLTATARVLQM